MDNAPPSGIRPPDPLPRRPLSPRTATALALLLLLQILGQEACAPRRAPQAPPVATREVRPKVGLALGGGGARGFAEIGVLRVLEQEKIPVDMVAGTSVGSLVGALYADSGRVLDAEFLAVSVREEDLFDYRALAIFSGGFVQGDKLEEFLETHLKHKTLESMSVPFVAVATDLGSGQTLVLDRGPVARAVHASCAIPGVFVPVDLDGRTVVDGGVTDPVPADVLRERGAEVVIGVAIPAGAPARKPKTPIEVAYQSALVMAQEIGACRAKEADVIVAPDVAGVAFDDFTQKRRLMEAGERAAREALPAIREAIAAKTRTVPVP